MKRIEKNENDFDMKKIYKLINVLIKEDKLKFNYYNNNINKVELLQLCYNKKDNVIEFGFRNDMSDYLEEMKELINKIKDE